MSAPILAAGLILAAYLIGAIPFGLLIGRMRGVDIRQAGSGNIGATNVARLLGARWGALALVSDMLKGMIPVLLAGRALERFVPSAPTLAPWWLYPVWLAVGLACVVGHILPVYLRLRGGKGVATSLGVVLGFWPVFTIPGLAALGVFLLVALATRYVSLASMTAALAFPVAFFLLRGHMPLAPGQAAYFIPFAVFLPLVILWRHRANIRRLLAGREPRIGQSAPPDPSSIADGPAEEPAPSER